MARSFRIASLITAAIAGCVALGALPAAAQFNPFEAIFGSPPRPPSSVPGRQPQQGYPQYPERQYPDRQYPEQQHPEQQYPGQARIPRQGPAGGVQSQPLPPPSGSSAAIDQRGPMVPPRPPRGTPQPADTSPQPGDEVVAEPPSQKMANNGALFSGLDKITGRIINFDVAIGETVQFGALQVTPRICYTRPPTETPNTDAFIEVDEVTLQGDVKRIFTGWVFAASPGLHAVEHPIYDVWLTDCKNPAVAAAAPPPEPPLAAQPAKPPAPATQRRPPQQAPQGMPQGTMPRR